MNSAFEDTVVAPLHEFFTAAGAVCSVSTNSELVLAAARDIFTPAGDPPRAADAKMVLWVDESARGGPPWPSPHFRGLDHLVFAAFDAENMVLTSLRERRAIGRLSPAMAADRAYLRRVVFPTLFGIFTDVIPVAPVHCACVEREGRGLLLTGASGSGKSTLSLALAQQGFGFLSDEWTYFSWREGRLLAWGLPVPLKLLPDARRHFPELARVEPEVSLNGEMAYEIEPESVFGVRRSGSAEPDWLIFLERQNTPSFSLSRVSPIEAATEFEELVGYFAAHRLSEGRDRLVRTIEDFGRISCWRLRYGGQPAAVAGALSEFLDSEDRAARPAERFSSAFAWNRMAPDFLRRSTPTALVADLHVMGHAVRLETNSVTLLQYARRALERHTGAQCPSPEFLWRLVSEPDTGFKTPCREMAAFSDRASSLVSFGQGSFIAVDLETREAVGFLEEKFTKDELEFVRLVLAALLTWTAPAIGLTCDQAASVNQEVLESLSLGHAGDS